MKHRQPGPGTSDSTGLGLENWPLQQVSGILMLQLQGPPIPSPLTWWCTSLLPPLAPQLLGMLVLMAPRPPPLWGTAPSQPEPPGLAMPGLSPPFLTRWPVAIACLMLRQTPSPTASRGPETCCHPAVSPESVPPISHLHRIPDSDSASRELT